jgi:hypothetical protein
MMLRKLFDLAGEWLSGVKPSSKHAVFELRFRELVIGELHLENGEWVFSYSEQFRMQDKFAGLIDFPDNERVYRSKELWPFFALRIPSLTQPSVQAVLRQRNQTEMDEVDMLKTFGQSSVANPYQLVAMEA